MYIIGQSLVGAAAGIYWPAAEFGVPYFCHPIETRKAYALVRSSEALGIFLGVFLGGYMTNFLYSKSIFIFSAAFETLLENKPHKLKKMIKMYFTCD